MFLYILIKETREFLDLSTQQTFAEAAHASGLHPPFDRCSPCLSRRGQRGQRAVQQRVFTPNEANNDCTFSLVEGLLIVLFFLCFSRLILKQIQRVLLYA